MTKLTWQPDMFLPGYESHTWSLGCETAEGEPDVDLTATIVRRNPPRHQRAVLYVHGWNDYFFQTHLADFWDKRGFDFYAVDLRRYGRNLVPGLYAGYITNLHHYDAELSRSFDIIASEGHDLITLTGHSTGGLVTSVWASKTDRPINGLVLNSPWIDMHGPDMLQWAARPFVTTVATVKPTTMVQVSDTGLYWRSISATEKGEWHVDRDYKSNTAFQIRFGWGNAILRAQEEIDQGLGISTPILTMISSRSLLTRRKWSDDLMKADIVLDVEHLAATAHRLGDHVTLVRIPDGMHDLVLSPRPVRDVVFAEMARWLKVYVR